MENSAGNVREDRPFDEGDVDTERNALRSLNNKMRQFSAVVAVNLESFRTFEELAAFI